MQKLIIGFKFKFPNRTVASYNLGNAIYKQNQASEAKFAYAEAIKNTKSRPQNIKRIIIYVFMKEKIIPSR
jgi:hypothetical protein